MSARLFRIAFLVIVSVVFVFCLLGILFTGPVVVRVPRLKLDVDVSAERLRADVGKLCTELAPRNDRHMANLERTAEWIAEEFRLAGLAVEFQEYRVDARTFRNVVAHQPGDDPETALIVVGAHYDVFDDHAGADDNASGVAVLLELARTIPEGPRRRGALLVAFATEEPPYFGTERMGSHAFAAELSARGSAVHGMISLDMVGYYSDQPNSQRFPFPGLGLMFPDRGNFVAVVGDLETSAWMRAVKRGMISTEALPVESFRASPSWAPIDLSDHWSFRAFGFPAVQVTDTSFLRYPYYHTADDTPEKLDYERMGRLVEALHGVLLEGGGR